MRAAPWKWRTAAIFAAPLVAMIVQIALIGAAIENNADHSQRNTHYGISLFYFGMAVTLVSFPALAAAVRDARREEGRSWGFIGMLLNGAYLVFVAVALATLFLTSRGTRVISEEQPTLGLATPSPVPKH